MSRISTALAWLIVALLVQACAHAGSGDVGTSPSFGDSLDLERCLEIALAAYCDKQR